MTALVRYLAAELMLSQRFLVPVLLCAALMAIGTTGDDGPLLGAYAYGVAVVLMATAWLTGIVVDLEESAQRDVSVVAAGGPDRHLAATVVLAFGGGTVLEALALGYPLLAGRHLLEWGSIGVGVVAQLCAVLVGVTIGLLTSVRTIPSRGVGVTASLAVVLAVIAVDHVSPIRPLIVLLSGSRTPSQDVGPLLLLSAVSVLALAAGVLSTRAVTRRRD